MSYIKVSKRPLDEADLAAVSAAFGFGRPVAGLTPEQKAEQDKRIAPYFRSTPWSAPESRRSEGARRRRLKVLARKAAEREAQS